MLGAVSCGLILSVDAGAQWKPIAAAALLD